MRAEALMKTAEAMLTQRRLACAWRYFQEAESRGGAADRCAAGRWMVAMLSGNFSAAWRESDAIRERGAPDEHQMWSGEDLMGRRVIVHCLHGFGDTVQFVRYAGLLEQKAANVLWEVPPAMLPIASCFRDVHDAVTWGNGCLVGRDYDTQIEVMELPYLFRTTATDLPIAKEYLRLPRAIVQRAAREIGGCGKPRVGVVWSTGAWNESRSMPYYEMQRMFEVEDCEFWNLQGGACRHVNGNSAAMLHDAPVCSDGILCLAGAISQMDIVVTADTLAAHLAGALGIPTWLMLQYASDWRWMVDRDDSPWYPTMQIFRQPFPGAWREVVNAIKGRLESWVQRVERRRA